MAIPIWQDPRINYGVDSIVDRTDFERIERNILNMRNQAAPGNTTAGDGTAYTLTVPSIDALEDRVAILAEIHADSTVDNPTLNLNGLGAKVIKKADGTTLKAGELVAGSFIQMIYTGTEWRAYVQVKESTITRTDIVVTTTGTEPNYIVTAPGTSLHEYDKMIVVWHEASTGKVTLNFNGDGAVPVQTISGDPLGDGDIAANAVTILIKTSAAWVNMTPVYSYDRQARQSIATLTNKVTSNTNNINTLTPKVNTNTSNITKKLPLTGGNITGSLTVQNSTVWHAGNDGQGSGLDADKLQGAFPNSGAVANTIVKRSSSGVISAYGYISTLASQQTSTAPYFMTQKNIGTSGDNVIRPLSLSTAKNILGVTANASAAAAAQSKANSAYSLAATKEPKITKNNGFNLNKSDSISSTRSDILATSRAAKTAYDRGSTALSAANSAKTRADQAFQSASNGKSALATALTGIGIPASSSETFSSLASKIKKSTYVKQYIGMVSLEAMYVDATTKVGRDLALFESLGRMCFVDRYKIFVANIVKGNTITSIGTGMPGNDYDVLLLPHGNDLYWCSSSYDKVGKIAVNNTPKRIWEVSVRDASSIFIYNNILHVGGKGVIHRLQLSNGHSLSDITLQNSSYDIYGLYIDSTGIYTSNNGPSGQPFTKYSLSGSRVWSVSISRAVGTRFKPKAEGNYIYMGTGLKQLCKINKSTGKVIWQTSSFYIGYNSFFCGEYIVLTRESNIYYINRLTGAVTPTQPFGSSDSAGKVLALYGCVLSSKGVAYFRNTNSNIIQKGVPEIYVKV